MLKKITQFVAVALAVFAVSAHAAEKPVFRVAWSHYTGWEPWAYAQDSGILKKWADKYGVTIDLVLVADYMESINLYTAGKFDGCVMTNMDALTVPAVGGVDSSAIITGDFSDGNDGVVVRNGSSVADLKGRKIRLVELSVSHYLLARAFASNNMSERDVTLINSSDSDITSIFAGDEDPRAAVVTWNPMLMNVRNMRGTTMVFDSSKIPGEILDLMVVRTSAPGSFKRALTGAWYETLAVMSSRSKQAEDAVAFMAKTAGTTVDSFNAQLKTTHMFWTPLDAVSFTRSPKLKETMEYVRTFSFDHDLFGKGAKTKDYVGIHFPGGSITGNAKNVKFRFVADFMQEAADGKL